MAPQSHEIILHHYENSPYAEKARCALGMKRLAWRSVLVPSILPKPKLMPLTGGYRRTPNMQIGADIYCDTAMIIRELERRFPEPTIFPGGRHGMPFALGKWCDGEFFQVTRTLVFGNIADRLPEAFKKDRAALAGVTTFDTDAMKRAEPQMRDQCRTFIGWIEDHLSDGKPWVMGDNPGLADINCYMNVWLLRAAIPDIAAELLAEFPHVSRWADNMKDLGHGRREEIDADEALDIAQKAESETPKTADPHDPNGRKPGDRVTVTPTDYGKDPVEGEIVSLSAQHIAISRTDQRVGQVVVHFPRATFRVDPA